MDKNTEYIVLMLLTENFQESILVALILSIVSWVLVIIWHSAPKRDY